MTQRQTTVLQTRDALLDAFLRYYATAYAIKDDLITREREQLLVRDAALMAEPYIEMLPDYPLAEHTLEELTASLGVPETAALAAAGLLPYAVPYHHQAQALTAALSGRDVVVTSGTGSGKTESFLLPVLARLVRESTTWTRPDPSPEPWWHQGHGRFRPQRPHDEGRSPGRSSAVALPDERPRRGPAGAAAPSAGRPSGT